MLTPKYTQAVGTPDGSQTEFDTDEVYLPGSVWVLSPPGLLEKVEELGGTSVRLSWTPQAGDIIYFMYEATR